MLGLTYSLASISCRPCAGRDVLSDVDVDPCCQVGTTFWSGKFSQVAPSQTRFWLPRVGREMFPDVGAKWLRVWSWGRAEKLGSRVCRESFSQVAPSQTSIWRPRVGRDVFPDVDV